MPVRPRAHAVAADRRPRRAGPGRGDHDGADHGARRRDGAEGEDRQRHGPARHDVGDRHRARPVARRPADRRPRLAGDLPRQRAAGRPRLCCSLIAACPADRRRSQAADAAGFDLVGHAAARADARRLRARHDDSGAAASGSLNTALLAAAACGAGLFVLAESERRIAVDPAWRCSAIRSLSAGLAMSALVSTVMMATLVVGPFYLSRALGLDAARGRPRHVGRPARRRADRRAGRPASSTASAPGRMIVVGLVAMAAGSSCCSRCCRSTLGIAGYIAPHRRRHRRLRAVPGGQQHRRHGGSCRRISAASSPACSTCRATSG